MSFLTADKTAYLTGIFHSGHWLSFSAHEDLIIHRKPAETISNINASYQYGYGRSNSNESNITYTAQSGVYPCILRHKNDKQENQFIPEAMLTVIDGDVRIKVLSETKDYIEAEAAESFQIGDQFYEAQSEYFVQNFLGLKYYYYDLKKTK